MTVRNGASGYGGSANEHGSTDAVAKKVPYTIGDIVSVSGKYFANSKPRSTFYGKVSAIHSDGRARPFRVTFDDGEIHDVSGTNMDKVLRFSIRSAECGICHDSLLIDPHA
eukprot:COSAG01_NODE_35872_length_525_cov_1.422535_1_plen_111_part_00